MTHNRSRPSRLGLWFLSTAYGESEHFPLIGDFEEIYSEIVAERGPLSASLWYWGQILRSIPLFISNSMYWSVAMLKNYLKVIFRNIRKHRGYSFINITGLAIGMACCLLISIWVLDELGYDKFHEKAPNLYRVEEDQYYSGRIFHVSVTPHPLGPALVDEIPEIVEATRYVWSGGLLFRYGEKAFFEYDVRAVDPSFLQMFTFPLVKGDKNRALDSPHSLIISEDIAEKYFGTEDPLGKVITINNTQEFTVTGVAKNVPHNSTFQFEVLLPYTFLEKIGRTNLEFGSNSIGTYVELTPHATMEQVNEKILGFIKAKVPNSVTELVLKPFTKIHLHSYWGYEKDAGAIQYVYMFSIIAIFVLLIACINFMNLSTARSANRAKEVGMRKVVGALKSHLIRQFYGESVVFAFIALVLAAGIVTALLPAFSKFAHKDLSWNVAGIGTIFVGVAAITFFTGMVAGSYPALFLSAFQPVKVIRGTLKSGAASSWFRKILVVVQFSLSILLVIGTVVVYQQLTYMKAKRLGWDREHLVYIPLRSDVKKAYDTLKIELLKDSHVLNATASSELPSYIGSNSSNFNWEGKDPDFKTLIGNNPVDYDFVETLKIGMKEGRSFSREYSSDRTSAFVINEEVARLMGRESVVGESCTFFGREGTIIGVMKNWHYQPIRRKIEPLVLYINPEGTHVMLIRIPAGNISESLTSIENVWKRVIPNYPFEHYFLDENFDEMYRREESIGTLLKYFAALAIFVACLGLFGLASFTSEQRTKEVGIRKVLGATVSNITVLLCREFFLLVFISNIIAWPVAYFLMRNWLQSYAYRTSLSVLIFIGAMAIALIVALLSVSFQALRAATANPINSLRYE
jgi:ABC-type antimicrobial peptide transport system permease subunit